MAILDFFMVIGLGSLVGLYVFKTLRHDQRQQVLQNAFYQLLEDRDGQVSLIQLAVAAKVDALAAQEFLEQQVRIFSAIPEVDVEGNTFYRFPKLRSSRRSGLEKRQDDW